MVKIPPLESQDGVKCACAFAIFIFFVVDVIDVTGIFCHTHRVVTPNRTASPVNMTNQ
jgi:hypothetical protein